MSPICRKCGDLFDSDRWYHRTAGLLLGARDEGRRHDGSAPSPRPLDLDPRLLRDAISLTHPDRHPSGRSKVENAATAALLELLHTVKKGEAA